MFITKYIASFFRNGDRLRHWQMENSVYTSFWAAFYCSKLVGSMPLKRIGRRLQWSWGSFVYIFLFSVPCVVYTFVTPYVMFKQTQNTLNISSFVQIFYSSLVGLTGIISLVISLWKTGALPNLLDEFRHLDACLLHTPPKTNKKVLIYSFCHCLIIISICGTFAAIISWEHANLFTFGNIISVILAQMYLATAEIQFVCLSYALSQRYKHINSHIKKLCNNGFTLRNGPHDVSTTTSENEIYVALNKFRKSHRSLHNIGRNLNRIYDGQLFLSLTSCFTLSVCCFYYGIINYNLNKFFTAASFLSAFQYFLRFYIINSCCHTTSEEVRFFAITHLDSFSFPRRESYKRLDGNKQFKASKFALFVTYSTVIK